MVLGIGTDIIEIDRIKEAIKRENFMLKCFTEEEILRFPIKKVESIAGNFAAKESVSKALGTGFVKFDLKDIEILRDDRGKPFVNLYNNAKNEAANKNIKHIEVSISHCEKYAVAFVVASSGNTI